MKQLAVISGKGGCGKTTLTAAFFSLAKDAVLADCDVDAADMSLVLSPSILEKKDSTGLELASIDPERCTGCWKCIEVCRFDAILENFKINPYNCEGCAVCTLVCPENAVSLSSRVSGQAVSSITRFGPLIHGELEVGEEASGKLVTLVRNQAREIAEANSKELVIIDGPPGTSCPAIAAITGADLVLLLSEPTVSGLHDLKRVAELTKQFRIPAVACINKADINEKKSLEIELFCKEAKIPLLAKLPYADAPTKAMLKEETVIEYASLFGDKEAWDFAALIQKLWNLLEIRLSSKVK